MDDGGTGGTRTVLHDLDVLNALADDLQRVQHTCQHNDGGAVLVIVEHGDIQLALQLGLDLKAFGAADILQIDAAEGGGDRLDSGNDLLLGFGVQADGKGIYPGKFLEQDALALHDRQTCLGADVAKAQHGGAVGDNGDRATLHGVGVDVVGVCLDLAARLGDAGGVGGGQSVTVLAGDQTLNGDFTGKLAVQFQGGFVVIHGNIPLFFSLWRGRCGMCSPAPGE